MSSYEYADQDGDKLRVRPAICRAGAAFLATTGVGMAIPASDVEEVCAALREAAGLPPVWTVEKREDDGLVAPSGLVRWLPSGPDGAIPDAARSLAARLLAAADEAEARANRPKLPTAVDSVIKVGGKVWVRGETVWNRAGSPVFEIDMHISKTDFAVLYDPEKAS